jgi:CheY-like chemotaxis protein
MSHRVLFVDDEVNLLNGIKRRIGGQLDLATACSGEEGLRTMVDQGPFAVIVTDMRMPHMDGIQFVKAARAKSPNSVFIMLTGNQDQTTAIQALNEGHVFRFLNKPCQSQDLLTAVEAAMRQYELIVSEKELLHGTFVGAVNVLTDVLELAQPSIFGRAERLQDLVVELHDRMRLESRWEYKLAAKLALLGFALLPEHDRTRFEMGIGSDGELHARIKAAGAIGQRIVERIPRLGTVARIIGAIGASSGNVRLCGASTEAEIIETGATLVRVAIEWDFLVRQGQHPRAAVENICAGLPNLHPVLAAVLAEQEPDVCGSDSAALDPSELVEGMTLYEDVLTADGVILIRKGRRLTWTLIEKLRGYESSDARLRPIRIQTARAAVPQEPLLV